MYTIVCIPCKALYTDSENLGLKTDSWRCLLIRIEILFFYSRSYFLSPKKAVFLAVLKFGKLHI